MGFRSLHVHVEEDLFKRVKTLGVEHNISMRRLTDSAFRMLLAATENNTAPSQYTSAKQREG